MGFIANVRRDWKTVSALRRILKYIDDLGPEGKNIVPDDLEASVDKYRSNVAFRFEGDLITYVEFEARANRVAHWALSQGLKAGDAVAIFMANCPDYVAVWFGLSKIGVISGLINYNLADEALAHCINIAEAKVVICGAEQAAQLDTAREHLEGDQAFWCFGAAEGCEDLEVALAEMSDARPPRSHREHLRGADVCLYVYTSGTTGLPKAAKLTHMRTQGMMRTFVMPTETTARDRVYVSLPLYHSTGGICAVGISLMTGASVILRQKFSVSKFWDDIADNGATVFVYIGELCRYLLNQPEHPKERAHNLRTGFGNGLRPEIWQEFLDRFNVPGLVEFYGSTEGNVNFLNVDRKVGAVGRIPKILEKRFSYISFVKFDVETEMPIRGEDGFCIPADPDEPAEVLGRIQNDDPRTRFEGYRDKEATQKKLLTDVFEKGDSWFRTGDLMRKDAEGYVYFVDRIGDTFRWKGENVSTNEVADVLGGMDGVGHANVYGVPIAGMDGKAGMAAITPEGDLDFSGLHGELKQRLPAYAVPLFIRIQREAETTGTFKYRKVDLVKEGFDPDQVGDPVWFAHPDKGEYVPLTHDVYESILSGSFRL
ncbi:MAG: long-chain-acyl-CoA synthetase [Pseudomonadota bacterium]